MRAQLFRLRLVLNPREREPTLGSQAAGLLNQLFSGWVSHINAETVAFKMYGYRRVVGKSRKEAKCPVSDAESVAPPTRALQR